MNHHQVAMFIVVLWLLVTGATNRMMAQGAVRISFVIVNAGFDVSGTIDGVETDIRFTPDDLASSRARITAKPSTIRTGIALRDRHLQQPDFFDVTEYPVITMQSRGFHKTGRNKFSGTFDLTIKHITRTVVVSFSSYAEGRTTRCKGYFAINRLDFELGEPSPILDDTVKITVDLVL